MGILRFFGTLIGILVAALFGNWVGDQLRARATGEKGHQFQVSQPESSGGETTVSVRPNLTNFGPAIAAGLLMRPHVAWSFLGGVLASGLMGERYENQSIDWLKSKLPNQKMMGEE